VKRGPRHGCKGVAWLELTERVGRAAHLHYLLEPAAGGRGVAETAGGSTRASSSTANGRPGWPPCGVEVSITSLPCTLRCLSARLGDVSHAYHRPRVQELGSEASWHLFFTRRASTPWSSFGRRGWPMSAIRARGELRMSGMGAGELCEGLCSFVHAVCVLASGRSRTCHCGFLWRLCQFVIFVISVVPACRIESMPIA
jgi:hypothetical protein